MTKFYLITILSLISVLLYAQDENVNPEWKSSGDWEFGALVGYTTNSLSLDDDFDDPEDEVGNSYIIGVLADRYFNKNWSIRARLNYEDRDFGSGSEQYLTTSITPNWHFGKNRRWNLQLGPNYSYNLDSGIVLGSSFGTDFGIGVTIPIGGLRFFIELDGVTDFNAGEIVITDVAGNVIGRADFRINRSSISFGLRF